MFRFGKPEYSVLLGLTLVKGNLYPFIPILTQPQEQPVERLQDPLVAIS
jgi:hypothetical protein